MAGTWLGAGGVRHVEGSHRKVVEMTRSPARLWVGACLALALGLVLVVPAHAARTDVPSCFSPASKAYALTTSSLTGPAGGSLWLAVTPAPGCAAVDELKKVELGLVAPDGTRAARKFTFEKAPGGVAELVLGPLARGTAIAANVLVRSGTPERTYVVRADTTAKLRPDLVVESITPQQALVGKPVAIEAVIAERNGDLGATATVSLSAVPGATRPVEVAPGGRVTVRFDGVTFGSAVPVELTVAVAGAAPVETDTANNTRVAVLDVTEHQLPTPRVVLFPSLLGYGAQFGMHVYAPITPWPAGESYGNFEEKVRTLQPDLVRIFYNDRWDGNADGGFPDWETNFASFVKVVELAQQIGATVDISFQNLSVVRDKPPDVTEAAMAKFADVLRYLVRERGFTNIRWAEVGNEPNGGAAPNLPTTAGGFPFDQLEKLYRQLHAQLVARGLRQQIQLMGPGLIENAGVPSRDHYAWLQKTASEMGDIIDGYAEHVYWIYDDAGRLEYRLRDTWHLTNEVLPEAQRKPVYMMEFGIRGYNSCAGKPNLALQMVVYYRPGDCSDIWRTNIAGFQQFWFNVASAQLGVAGAAKWDAFWSRYDLSSPNNQLYWTIGPPTEGSPLTPTYYALSLLFHTTVPGWQIVRVEPWEADDWGVPQWRVEGHRSIDQREKELVAYAGPAGELTVVGLDTNGRNLNAASTAPPVPYSIGGLPPNGSLTLALWNATGDGTNSVAGTVTTNTAGVARFEVPLHAAFALTNVPVS